METVYELRCRFDDDTVDVVASEYSADELQISQDGDLILIPKSDALAFADALMAWVSQGGGTKK